MGTIRETLSKITVVRASPGTLGRRSSEDLGRELADLSCGAILAYQRRLSGQGGRLHVCGLSRSVRLLFLLLCIHRRLEVFNTEYEAVEAFRQ
jgi:hypothetical protein